MTGAEYFARLNHTLDGVVRTCELKESTCAIFPSGVRAVCRRENQPSRPMPAPNSSQIALWAIGLKNVWLKRLSARVPARMYPNMARRIALLRVTRSSRPHTSSVLNAHASSANVRTCYCFRPALPVEAGLARRSNAETEALVRQAVAAVEVLYKALLDFLAEIRV